MPLLPPRMRHRTAIAAIAMTASAAMLTLVTVARQARGMAASRSGARGDSRGDTLCARPPAVHDSVRVVVTAIARVDSVNIDNPPALSLEFLQFVVEAVRTHFVPPANLDLSSMGDGMPHPPADWLPPPTRKTQPEKKTTPLLAVDAYFSIDASGAPRDIRLGRSSMPGALAQSVESAIRAIVPTDYGIIPRDADGARVHFHLEAAPATIATDQPFFTTWLPVYDIQKHPSLPRHAVQPVYPEAARRMGITDTVLAAFAIGADGHVIPGTVDILSARYTDFTSAVTSALMANSYQPLVASGCRLTSTVREMFTFDIR